MTKSICDLDGCNKKIKLVNKLVSTCYCGKTHCDSHRLSETHKCDYDFAVKLILKIRLKR